MSDSIRTPERPMAFTSGEFWGGAWRAWGLFMALLLGGMTVLSLATGAGALLVLIIMYAGMIGGGISLLAMLVFSPIAWVIARCMRGVATRWVHASVFTVFGATVGGITCSAFSATAPWFTAGYPPNPWAWAMMAISAAAVGIGWWRASQHALHRDDFEPRGTAPGASPTDRSTDIDAAFEDRALGD